MSDIFDEIADDLRSEKLRKLWSQYSFVVYGLAVAIVIGTAAYVYHGHQRRLRDEAAGTRFEAAQALATQKKPEEAAKAFEAIAKNAPEGYASLARLRAAEETGINNRAAAVKLFDAIAADSAVDPLLRGVAQLHAAILVADTASKDELERRLGILMDGPFRQSAREFLALAALNRGDYPSAGRLFEQIITDPSAPPSLRERARAFLSLVQGGGKYTPPAPAPAKKTDAPAPKMDAPAKK